MKEYLKKFYKNMLLKYKVKLNSDGVFMTTEFLVEPIQELLSSYFQSSEGGVLELLAFG